MASSATHRGPSVTKYLRNRHPTQYQAATSMHPFLISAGTRNLDSNLLAFYLSQDRIYAAHAYPRFIGSLIAKIPFDSAHHQAINVDPDSQVGDEEKNQYLLSLLTFALTNAVREATFFVDTAHKYGLDIWRWKERKATRDYVAEMGKVGGMQSLEEGLVFLWAMEQVYLDAWTSVKNLLQSSELEEDNHLPIVLPASLSTSKERSAAAVDALVENWTCMEFREFVDQLASLVDRLDIVSNTFCLRRAVVVWDRVVELEKEFWPTLDELALRVGL